MNAPSKIKVVHLINGLDVGGAETMLLKLTSEMNRTEFSNVVITLTDGGSLRDGFRASNIPVHSLGMRRGRPTIRGFFRLLRILHKLRPHVVQTWLYHADLLGLVAARLTRVPRCVWNIRVSDLDMQRYPWISRRVLRMCVRLSRWPDLVLVNSVTSQEFHTQLGYRPRKWKVIPNGFDTQRFRPDAAAARRFRHSLGRPDDFLVGLFARYDPMKDHPNFLKAVQLFLKNHPEAHFVLGGTGIDHANSTLTGMAASLGIRDALTLLGKREDVHAILPALDVLTLSSAFGEGFSNAIGEGMACAVPCVVTDVGDMAAVVGTCGRVVAPSDPGALVNAWTELHEMGPDGRNSLGALARRRIESTFSLARVVGDFERAYANLLHLPAAQNLTTPQTSLSNPER